MDVIRLCNLAGCIGESFHFGISTQPPARGHVSAFSEGTGLALAEYEPFGKQVPFGGLVLAVRRD